MNIFAIDPGPQESAWVEFCDGIVIDCGIVANKELATEVIPTVTNSHFAIEQIRSYGMAVGAEVFETCEWCGRFDMAIQICHKKTALFVPRKDVKMHLCGTPRAKDKNIRQALIDFLGAPGTKNNPGPTYGCKSHVWAALGVAVTAEAIINGTYK